MDMSKEGMMGEGTSSICRRGRSLATGEILAVKVYKPPKKSDKDGMKTMLLKYKRQIEVLRDLMEPFDPPSVPAHLWNDALAKMKPARLFMKLVDYTKDAQGVPSCGDEGLPYVITRSKC